MNLIKIGNKLVGKNQPCYIIAEIGSNFDGSLSKAKRLIDLAKKSGADCAKFQSFLTEKLLSRTGFEKNVSFQSKWNKPVWDVYKKAEFPRDWHEELFNYSKKKRIHFMATPYDFESVDLLNEIGVPAFKIGSGDITYLEFLEYIARKKKPILLPTGASTLDEIKQAIQTIKNANNKRIILMQSVTQYPSPIEDANISAMVNMGKKFKLNFGYSDHSPKQAVPIASVALGACVIEKHFTDNTKNKGPDHPHSLDPSDFSNMVQKIREVEKALGNGLKKVEKSEKQTRIIQRRSIFTIKEISEGEKFSTQNTACLRPFIGISASEWKKILKKRAKRNIQPYVAITKNDFY